MKTVANKKKFSGHFYVLRKRRYCGLPARKDLNYCGEHLNEKPDKEGLPKRIPCPYDNSQ